jgi:hypothetical protein
MRTEGRVARAPSEILAALPSRAWMRTVKSSSNECSAERIALKGFDLKKTIQATSVAEAHCALAHRNTKRLHATAAPAYQTSCLRL